MKCSQCEDEICIQVLELRAINYQRSHLKRALKTSKTYIKEKHKNNIANNQVIIIESRTIKRKGKIIITLSKYIISTQYLGLYYYFFSRTLHLTRFSPSFIAGTVRNGFLNVAVVRLW